MAHIDFDFMIVGQGLAGSVLAHHLIDMNQKVVLLGSSKGHSSSKVAAGLYNPITGRKMVKSWKAGELFPYLTSYYSKLEAESNEKFLYDMEMYRPFLSVEEQNEWIGRSADENYATFIEQIHLEPSYKGIKDSYGGLKLKGTGYVALPQFLKVMSAHIQKIGGLIIDDTFNYDNLVVSETSIVYGDLHAKRILFCEGTGAEVNPYFGWLPFKLVKGEIIEIEAELISDFIINRGVFVIPLGNNRFKVGATYNNFDINWNASNEGKLQIENKLQELVNVNYKLINHYAGVRPATRDRKPFIGMHPKYKNVGIFNGLGAKGVSLSPYFANQFALHLVNQSALDQEVAIDRYFKFYEEENN